MPSAAAPRHRRRAIQEDYNKKHGITPKTIVKAVGDVISATTEAEEETNTNAYQIILKLENEMKIAAEELRFEDAARIRDRIKRLKKEVM